MPGTNNLAFSARSVSYKWKKFDKIVTRLLDDVSDDGNDHKDVAEAEQDPDDETWNKMYKKMMWSRINWI